MTCWMERGRELGGALCTGLVLAFLMLNGVAAGDVVAGGATEAIKGTIDEVLRILADKELKQPTKLEQRRQLLEKVVGDRFDYTEMSRRALGAPWGGLSDKEKEEFVGLFRTHLINTYAKQVESYTGEGAVYVNERTEKDYAEVQTKLLTGKTEIRLDYRLLNKSSEWRVYDVVVENTSLVRNYRAQFTKILQNGTFAELIDQLRKKKSDKIKTP